MSVQVHLVQSSSYRRRLEILFVIALIFGATSDIIPWIEIMQATSLIIVVTVPFIMDLKVPSCRPPTSPSVS